jgi:flagellar basal body L-ring protein FlgH
MPRHLFLLPLLLASCAVLDPQEPVAPRPVVHLTPPPKITQKRQFGALWSEDSVWNDVYSASAIRAPGDILVVKLDDALKQAIAEKYDQLIPPVEDPDPVVVSDTDSNAEQNAAAREKVKRDAEKQKELQAPKTVRTLVREVRARGGYLVSGSEVVTLGKRKPRVFVQGLIRDKDISTEESVTANQLMDLKWEIAVPNTPRYTASVETEANGG